MTETCPHCGYSLKNDEVIERDGWTLDPRGQAKYRGKILPINKTAARLLHSLAKENGRPIEPDILYERCIDNDDPYVIYAVIAKLRRKLHELKVPCPIQSRRGRHNSGYWWQV